MRKDCVRSDMENKAPIRKKAIETRQKLIMATIEQVADKGYHNVTADDIARACGVSTGCAYRYFKNKKEMLLAAIEYCFANIRTFSGTEESRLSRFKDMEEMLAYALDQFYVLHKKYYGIHEELESLRHIDEDVRALYDKIMEEAVLNLMEKCPEELKKLPDLKERLYVAIGILDNYAHLQMDDNKSSAVDTEAMKRLSIKSALVTLKL